MKIQIKRPVALHEAGGKSLNEDFIWPTKDKASADEELFIVCDGEGGPNAGENASKLVGLSFAKFYASTPPVENSTQAYLEAALMKAEAALSAYKDDHEDKKQMRATLSLLHLGKTELCLAWVGDSQAYYYSHEKQELLGSNQAEFGTNEQGFIEGTDKPATIKSVSFPYSQISDQDYFFLGSKGIAEQVGITTLNAMFSAKNKPDPDFIIGEINSLSEGFTKDNYSCYLIQVEKSVQGTPIKSPAAKITNTSPGKTPEVMAASSMTSLEDSGADNSNLFRNIAVGALVLLLGWLFLVVYLGNKENKFDSYMAQAEQLIQSKNYYNANDQIDSALSYVDREFKNANIEQEEMTQMKARANKRKADIATLLAASSGTTREAFKLADLNLTAQEYIDWGNESMRLGKYQDALDNYEKANIKKAGAESPDIPVDSLAMAYLKLGNMLFDEQGKDCNMVLANLNKAFSYSESKVLDQSNSLYQQSLNRAKSCNLALGRSTKDLPQIAQNSRGLDQVNNTDTEAEKGSKEAETKRIASNQPTSTSTKSPETNAPAQQQTRSAEAAPTRRVSKSGINSTNLRPEVESRLRKTLSHGKRFYSQAKDQDSDYLYKQSAIQLEQAAAVLDGSGAYLLAYLYHMGQGVDADKVKALKYAQKSALKNWPAGHYLYAHLLLLRGNARDTITAKQSLQRASDLNYLEAVKRLQQIP